MKLMDDFEDDGTRTKLFVALAGLMLGALIIKLDAILLLVLIVGVAGILLTFIDPLFGLCLLAFSLPFAGLMKIIPGLVTVNKLLGGLVAFSLLLYFAANHRQNPFRISNVIPIYLVFTLASLPYMLWSLNQADGWENFSTKFFIFGQAFMISVLIRSERQLKLFCAFAAGGAALLGVYVTFSGMGTLVGAYGERLAGGTNENVLAHALAVSLLLSGFLFLKATRRQKCLVLLMDLLILVPLGLTGSRGTWLALVVALVVLPLCYPGLSINRRILTLAVPLGLFCLVGFGISQSLLGPWGDLILNRISEISQASELETFSGGRMSHIWPMYLDEIAKRPLLGRGYEVKFLVGRASHNDLVTVMAETGLIGLAVFLFISFLLIKETLKCVDPGIKSLGIALFCFLATAGFAHNSMYLKSFSLAFGVLCCLPLIQTGTTLVASCSSPALGRKDLA